MKIVIKKISMMYFKGVRTFEATFNEGRTYVYGSNGKGKSTIADAIQWCLFGKNANGDAKFGIKTLDKEGNVIPNVEHSVTLTLSVDGEEKQIKRVWVEERVKSRGKETDEVKHHTEYYINGEKFQKVDFDNYMHKIIDEQVFRAVSSTKYFFSLPWQDQRRMLQDMADEVDYSAIDKTKYADALTKVSEHESINAYIRHLGYNISQIKEKLDEIPSRIDEQTRSLPQQTWADTIEQDLAEKEKALEKIDNQIGAIKSGAGNAMSERLQHQLEFQRKRIDLMRQGAQAQYVENERKRNEELTQLSGEQTQAHKNYIELEQKQHSMQMLLVRAKETEGNYQHKVEAFRKEWQENEATTFDADSINDVCPTCGQLLPQDEVAERRANARERFNQKKAEARKHLVERSEELKKEKAEIDATIKTYEDELANINLEQAKKDYENKKLAWEEKNKEATILSVEDILANNPSWTEAQEALKTLEQQVNGEIKTDNADVIAKLETERETVGAEVISLRSALHDKSTFLAIQKRIEELEGEQKTLNEQLDELIMQQDMIKDYVQECNELVEQSVNKLFSRVKFQLYETLNNGEKKLWCSAVIDGVRFADANKASKVNAGLDVCEAIARYYNFYAPITIDDAEGVCEVMPTTGQQILLIVSKNDETLRIE